MSLCTLYVFMNIICSSDDVCLQACDVFNDVKSRYKIESTCSGMPLARAFIGRNGRCNLTEISMNALWLPEGVAEQTT